MDDSLYVLISTSNDCLPSSMITSVASSLRAVHFVRDYLPKAAAVTCAQAKPLLFIHSASTFSGKHLIDRVGCRQREQHKVVAGAKMSPDSACVLRVLQYTGFTSEDYVLQGTPASAAMSDANGHLPQGCLSSPFLNLVYSLCRPRVQSSCHVISCKVGFLISCRLTCVAS